MRTASGMVFAIAAILASADPVLAAYDPSSAYKEAPGVAARYPDPPIAYATPAFAPGKQDFTSQAELLDFLADLAGRSPVLRLDLGARSQQGRELPVLFFSQDQNAIGTGSKPVVLIIGQQHGNEPAGGEAALVLAQRLGMGDLGDLLKAIDVIIVPRANPDGAAAFVRASANGIDLNRDHTLLRTPEIRALAALFTRFRPQLVLDCHEFTVGGRWVEKLGGLERIDAMIQYATVPNLPPSLEHAESGIFLPAILDAFDANGLTHDWYHTTDGSRLASPVSMGGIGPDTGRNVAGLRNAVSFLLETRGVGLGRAHLARRVQTHVVAAEAIMRQAARDPGTFMRLSAQAANEASQATSPFVIVAHPHPEQRQMNFVDPETGADKPVTVTWLSALEIEPVLTRPRPAGYVIAAGQTEAIATIRRAGLMTSAIAKEASIPGAHYRVIDVAATPKEDGRGDDVGAGAIVKGSFTLEKAEVRLAAGDLFIPANQPLAGLVAALLEPESDAGLLANRLLPAAKGDILALSRLDEAP